MENISREKKSSMLCSTPLHSTHKASKRFATTSLRSTSPYAKPSLGEHAPLHYALLRSQHNADSSLRYHAPSRRFATLRFTLNTTPALTRTCGENNFVCSERDSLEFIQHFRSKCYTIKKVINNGVRGVSRFAPTISITRVN